MNIIEKTFGTQKLKINEKEILNTMAAQAEFMNVKAEGRLEYDYCDKQVRIKLEGTKLGAAWLIVGLLKAYSYRWGNPRNGLMMVAELDQGINGTIDAKEATP